MLNNFFLSKIVPFMRKCEKICYSLTGHKWQYNMAHAHCILDTQGYKHTLIICNTYCSFTAKMTAGTRLNITLYAHRVLFIIYWITTEGRPISLPLKAPNNTTRSGDVKSCSLLDARHSPKSQVELITFNSSTRKMRHFFIYLHFLPQ
jgi:hypothetical protein